MAACSLGYGPPRHLLDLKHGSGLHDVLHAAGIVDAGQLHQNLVLAEAVLLNRRLAHAQRIDAVADGLDRLGHRFVLHLGEVLRLHGQSEGVIGPRAHVVFGETLGDDIHQILTAVRRHSLYHNLVGIVLRIGLGDVGEGNLSFIELLFENLDSVVGVNVHGIVDLHLQDQVGSATQIETKPNAVGHGREQTLAGKALRDAEYPKQKDE